jgi:predicted AlkP superfamily phosphohydrolase/phosphomutase
VRTLAIGMDAGDDRFVFDLIARGELPVMAALAERGAGVRLRRDPSFGSEVAWPNIVTGCRPGKHGMYNWRAIVPGTNRRVRGPSRTYRQPYWAQLRRSPRPRQVLLVDVPYAARTEDDGMTQLLGWGQRGAPRHASWPEDLLDRVRSRYGEYPAGLDREHHGRRRPGRRLLRALQQATEMRTRLTADLMRERDWDHCLVAYFEPHYGGHAFHRYLDTRTPGHAAGRRWHASSLLDVYRTFDAGVGELLDAAGPDVTAVVFSGFGMSANTSGVTALERVMIGLGYQVPRTSSTSARGTELLRRAALRATPGRLRRAINRRLPTGTSDRHIERLWIESTDWERTVAYSIAEPGTGFVRLAHPDRPGAATLRDEIATELLQLTDADSGRPAVARIVQRDESFSGPNAALLPDLAVIWSEGSYLRRIHHPRLGTVEEDLSGFKASEHTDEGFAIAAGPGIRSHGDERRGDVTDLAPTLLHLHGLPIPAEMDGTPLDVLDESLGSPRREQIDIVDDDPWRGR